MSEALVPAAAEPAVVTDRGGELVLPQLILDAGPDAVARFLEFFAGRIANARTRAAYGRAVGQFLAWCEARGLGLKTVSPLHVGAYIRTHPGSVPTGGLRLSAVAAGARVPTKGGPAGNLGCEGLHLPPARVGQVLHAPLPVPGQGSPGPKDAAHHFCRPREHLRPVRGQEAVLPDGSRRMLSNVNNFPWNWHINYIYEDDVAAAPAVR